MFGNNVYAATGQIAATSGSPSKVPLPWNVPATLVPGGGPQGIEGCAVRFFSTATFYYGYTSGLTSSNGMIAPAGAWIELKNRQSVWVLGSTTQTIGWDAESS